jgi:hypothetical protein
MLTRHPDLSAGSPVRPRVRPGVSGSPSDDVGVGFESSIRLPHRMMACRCADFAVLLLNCRTRLKPQSAVS